jgi:glycosyltransferase involved in cell wall biosynthesis
MHDQFGVVVIGRNEGERLRRCFESLGLKVSDNQADVTSRHPARVVYVDSGSTDGSVGVALSFGASVVELDLSSPFTAARARNEGLAKLCELEPEIYHVQFIDGDCSTANNWIYSACNFLDEHSQYAVVTGRLRERFPSASIYNRLCDMEWNTPIGDAQSCGGIAMMRVAALREVGGFNPTVIAGEEPELCIRLRQKGWRVRRLDVEMASHDAAMTHFDQWWKRAERCGYAYALGASLHGKTTERHWVRETRSTWVWGLIVPLLAMFLAWPTRGLSLVLIAGYPLIGTRVFRHMRRRGFSQSDSLLYAIFCVLAKFPQARGVLRFWWGKLRSKPSEIIEYKKPVGKSLKTLDNR